MRKFASLVLMSLAPWAFSFQVPDEFVDEGDEQAYGYGEQFARITYSDRYVDVWRDEESREAVRNYPLVSGDALQSRNNAYAEVEFIDGTLMQVDESTRLEFQAINEVFERECMSVIRLFEGGAFFHLGQPVLDVDSRIFRVDTELGSVYMQWPGIYRLENQFGRLTLKTYRGVAELSGPQASEMVRSGEYSELGRSGYPKRPLAFNSFHGDRFERWAYSRSPQQQSVSANYVDPEISRYAYDLDDHGEWRYRPELNVHVWVPSVSIDWRPYYRGYWTLCGAAMTWVSMDPFGWVTHHYGRWGWDVGFGWYWIPRRYYSPAWVAWTTFNDHIGWCPLGYWGRPYYYDRHHHVIANIFHHHHHHWHYAPADRYRDHTSIRVVNRYESGVRRVTTRAIHVGRGHHKSSQMDVRGVIRDPERNRSNSRVTARERGVLRSPSGKGDSQVVHIRQRSTGATAASRVSLPDPPRSRGQATPSSRTSSSSVRGNSRSEVPMGSTSRDAVNRSTSGSTRDTQSSGSRSTGSRTSSTTRKPTSSTTSSPRTEVTPAAPQRESSSAVKPASRDRTTTSPSRTPTPRSSSPSRSSGGETVQPSSPRKPDAAPSSGSRGSTSKPAARPAPQRKPDTSGTTSPRRETSLNSGGGTRAPSRMNQPSNSRSSGQRYSTAPRRGSSASAPSRHTSARPSATAPSRSGSDRSSHAARTSSPKPSSSYRSSSTPARSTASRPSSTPSRSTSNRSTASRSSRSSSSRSHATPSRSSSSRSHATPSRSSSSRSTGAAPPSSSSRSSSSSSKPRKR